MTTLNEASGGDSNSSFSTDSEPLNCTGFSTDLKPLNRSFSDEDPLNCSFSDESYTEKTSSEPISSTPQKSPDKIKRRFKFQPQVSPIAHCSTGTPPQKKQLRNSVDVLKTQCCKESCLKALSPFDVEICELQFKGKGTTQQRQYIVDNIRDKSQIQHSQLGKSTVKKSFVLRGKLVCDRAWCIVHDITYKKFLRCQKLFQCNITTVHHGNLGRSVMQAKTTEAIAWMQYLFERIGDWMPHKIQVHLPPTYTKKSMYERMVAEFEERGIMNTISYEHFTSVWADHLPQFIIAKRSEFTECTICTNLKEKRSKTLTDLEHKQVADMLGQHTRTVEKERKEYQKARERARRQPRDLTTIIIDGMDQAKTDVPHFIRRDKGSAHLARLPVHITGVLVHTGVPEGKVPIVFLDNKDVPHDSNMTINCLLKTLDNCFRENKNRYVMTFAALLVQLEVFEEVTMHFLPVGDTHEDVDQLFSCIAAKIRTANVYTQDDLQARITDSYTPFISVQSATPLFNVKKWLEPHLYGNFKHHSHPHWFRFQMIDGTCRMHWRMWASSPWEPQPETDSDGRDVELLKGLCCLKTKPDVSETPSWVEPCLEKLDVPALERDILHNEGYQMRLPQCAKLWWQRFFENIHDMEKVPDVPSSWPLQDLVKLNQEHSDTESLAEDLQLIQNKLTKEYPKI